MVISVQSELATTTTKENSKKKTTTIHTKDTKIYITSTSHRRRRTVRLISILAALRLRIAAWSPAAHRGSVPPPEIGLGPGHLAIPAVRCHRTGAPEVARRPQRLDAS